MKSMLYVHNTAYDCSPSTVNGSTLVAPFLILPRNSLIMTSLQRASRTGKLKAKSGASHQDGRLPSSITRRARGEKDSRSSKGKGERATECCLGRIWQSTARGTAGVAHTWLRFVVSSFDRPCCDTGRMTSASLDEWISVGAIVLDSYDTRESDLKPVLRTQEGHSLMASVSWLASCRS